MKKKDLLDFDNNLTFGVEIEFINANAMDIIKCLKKISPRNIKEIYEEWGYSTDFSFTKSTKGNIYGGEVKSKILKNNKKDLKDLKYILSKMKQNNAKVDDRTALHYHISKEAFKNSKDNLLKVLKLYLAYEHIIYKFGYNGKNPREALKKYAFPIRNILISILKELSNNPDFSSLLSLLIAYIIPKHHGVNFANLTNDLNTIEFRMCNASLDYEVIKNEINLFCNLVLSCQKELDEELIDYKLNELTEEPMTLENYSKINLKDAFDFSNMIFSSNESKEKFLLQYTK